MTECTKQTSKGQTVRNKRLRTEGTKQTSKGQTVRNKRLRTECTKQTQTHMHCILIFKASSA